MFAVRVRQLERVERAGFIYSHGWSWRSVGMMRD